MNAALSPSNALSPTSSHTIPIPIPNIEDTVEELLNISLTAFEDRNVKRLILFFALNGLSGAERLTEEKRLLEEHDLSKTYLPPKHLRVPPEIVDKFLYHAVLNLKPHQIVRDTQTNRKLARVNWDALYQKFYWLHSETISTPSEFKTLVKDARTYGQKTFEQIFAGFYLLKRIKENPNALRKMKITDLQQAGIYTDKWEFPPDADEIEESLQHFLTWIQTHPACILVCLRWVPAQNCTPDLLAEVIKHGNLTIVDTVFAFIKEHHITPFDAEHALREAVRTAHIPIADYLVNTVEARIRYLEEDILHQVVDIQSFQMIEWLVNKKVLLNHRGSDLSYKYYYGKTAADVAVSSLILSNFIASSKFRKNEMNCLHIALYLIDKGVPFNMRYQPEDMTLLHAVCYAPDRVLGLRVARLLIEQDPACIHIPTQDQNTYTPLHIAFQEKYYPLMKLLLEKGADATVAVPVQRNAMQKDTVIEQAKQLDDLDAQRILQETGNTGFASKHHADWHPEWFSTHEAFDAFIDDAGKYGQRTRKQVFEGLNILRLIKFAGAHAPITIAHLQRAGIVQKDRLCPDDIDAQNALIDWVRKNPAQVFACLRWMPPQRGIPDLLIEAVKFKEVAVVQAVFDFMREHQITRFNAQDALEQAIKNADIPITKYLWGNAGVHLLPANSLHIAAETGSVKMVQWMIKQGALLDKKGIELDNRNAYAGKTAAEVAVSAITASHFAPNASKADRDKGVNLLHMACYLLQAGQIRFDKRYTPAGMSLLHAACYAPSEQDALWLAQFALHQNPACIHAVDSEGAYAFI